MKSQQTLSRVVGSHLSLLGMAAYTLMSGPASAFAAITTDTKTLTVTANVGNYIAMTQVSVPSALTLTPPPTGSGVNTATGDATYTVNTNTSNGYNVNISAPFGTGSCTTALMCIGTATPIAQTFTPATALGANAAVLTNLAASNGGLGFHVMSTSTGYNSTNWGADDAALAEYAGVPQTSTQVLTTAAPGAAIPFNVRFIVGVPAGQLQGSYTSSTVTLTAVTNS